MSSCRIRKYTSGSSNTSSASTQPSTQQPNSLTNDLSTMIAARNKQDALFTSPPQEPAQEKKK